MLRFSCVRAGMPPYERRARTARTGAYLASYAALRSDRRSDTARWTRRVLHLPLHARSDGAHPLGIRCSRGVLPPTSHHRGRNTGPNQADAV